MAITTESPVTVAAAEHTFGVWWLTELTVRSHQPNVRTTATATFALASVDEDGTVTFYRDAQNQPTTARHDITDLFALAAQQPDVGALVAQVIAAVGALTKDAGAIS